jgi:hypothetical protein
MEANNIEIENIIDEENQINNELNQNIVIELFSYQIILDILNDA